MEVKFAVNCPYCSRYFNKKKLAVEHMNKVHARELDEEGLDACQSLYKSQYGRIEGRCTVCGSPTGWNYKTGKPYRLCSRKECRHKLRELAVANGADGSLLQDMEFQKEMQRHRKIGGVYKFKTDGGEVEYLSQLELSFLKFCDVIMEFPSCMVQCSPENFKYYDPKDKVERTYMPDFYLPDYNLIVEIKDANNQNPEFIKETKYKVALKDEVMKKQTKYNYIRINGTNYGPFMETLFRIVHEQGDDDKKRNAVIVISESACMDPDEKVNWNQPEVINADRIRLMIGYIQNTNSPAFVAITDSKLMASWYLSDIENQTLAQATGDNPIFADCGYRIYKYIGDAEKMQAAFSRIIATASNGTADGSEWYIPAILAASEIMFDDGIAVRNNEQRMCSFVLQDQYFWTPGELADGGEDE